MSVIPSHPALNCAGRLLDLSLPRVMGILNVTPDSFSDGGALYRAGRPVLDLALTRAAHMVQAGASLIDIGGESTRPGAALVSTQEELDRVLPVLDRLKAELDVVLSVDTSNPTLMLEAAARGAGFINDVRALTRDGALQAAAATGLPVCLMHMQGEPQTMQRAPHYVDVVREVADFLRQRLQACTSMGIAQRNIVLDPGFGFGKTAHHNLTLLNRLDQLHSLGHPLLVGLSRKSVIKAVLGSAIKQPLAGSLALASAAVLRGAAILRVHDVEETVACARLCAAVMREATEF